MEEAEELEMAWAAFAAHDYDTAIKQAESKRDLPESQKLIGLANFRKGNYQAAKLALAQYASHSNGAMDWFNLSTSSAMANDAATAIAAFENCNSQYSKTQSDLGLSLAQLHWYFMKSMVTAGFEANLETHLRYLVTCYRAARISDSHYLSTRGLPDWESFLEVLEPTLLALPNPTAQELLELLKSDVDAPARITLERLAKR